MLRDVFLGLFIPGIRIPGIDASRVLLGPKQTVLQCFRNVSVHSAIPKPEKESSKYSQNNRTNPNISKCVSAKK